MRTQDQLSFADLEEERMVEDMERREIFFRLNEIEADLSELIDRARYYGRKISISDVERLQRAFRKITETFGE